jgi:lipopolysaccharide export system protein LptC
VNAEKSARTFRLVVILTPLVALALGSFWLYEIMRRASDQTAPAKERQEPDFYVENFNYVKMSKTGKAEYHFSGARLTHNPQDDSYNIEQPVVSNVSNTEAPMTMRAEHATVNNDNSEVHMYDNVRVNRPATPKREAMQLKSEYLLVLPDDDAMRTDKPVEITEGPSKLTGVGMYANNATREFQLMSNVHGTYQPVAR